MIFYSMPGSTLHATPSQPKLEMAVSEFGKSPGQNRFHPISSSVAPPPSISTPGEVSATHTDYVFSATQKKVWTKHDERDFLDLSRKFALDVITDEEARKLERMERMRNALNSNRTYREILAEKRQFEKADKLIQALYDYLETAH